MSQPTIGKLDGSIVNNREVADRGKKSFDRRDFYKIYSTMNRNFSGQEVIELGVDFFQDLLSELKSILDNCVSLNVEDLIFLDRFDSLMKKVLKRDGCCYYFELDGHEDEQCMDFYELMRYFLSEGIKNKINTISVKEFAIYFRRKRDDDREENSLVDEIILEMMDKARNELSFEEVIKVEKELSERRFFFLLYRVKKESVGWDVILNCHLFEEERLMEDQHYRYEMDNFLYNKTEKDFILSIEDVLDDIERLTSFFFSRYLISAVKPDQSLLQQDEKLYLDRYVSYLTLKLFLRARYGKLFNNKPSFFKESNQHLIGKFFQQGGEYFFKNLLEILKDMPKDKKSFWEQYEFLERKTRPSYEWAGRSFNKEIESDPSNKKQLVYYYRFEYNNVWHIEWQGVDGLQTAMILGDLLRMKRNGGLEKFDKIIVVPRQYDDFPYFARLFFEKEFGKEFTDKYLVFDNDFHKWEKDPNAHFINMVHGRLQKNKIGITSVINKDRIAETKKPYIEVPIFWPTIFDDIDNPDYYLELGSQGRTNISDIRQPKSLKDVREVMIKAVDELQKVI